MILSERKKLTKMVLEQRAPASGRIEVRDAESPLVFRITSSGNRSLCVRTRLGREQVRLTYPKTAAIQNLPDARRWALETIEDCQRGVDPRTVQETVELAEQRAAERAERLKFENVLKVYLDRRVRQEKKNRSADQIEKTFGRYVLPRWHGRKITEISRGDVNALLDDVYDKKVVVDGKRTGGPVAANAVLAYVRAFFNWFATQEDQFTSPIVPGMARTNPRDIARERVLSDDELRVLWPLLSKHGIFGSILQTLLLTAQRRDDVADLARSEITGGNVWEIPAERYKTKRPHVVLLTSPALDVIAAQTVIDRCDFVFTTNGQTPLSGFSKCKRRLDDEMLGGLLALAMERDDRAMLEKYGEIWALFESVDAGDEKAALALRKKWWRVHDLRRTAKTLMQRAGVRPDISERVLGHVITGVEGVYDRHAYLDEKRDALERLAAVLERIVKPLSANIVPLRMAAE